MTARIPTQQYSFTSGMLDDALEARTDIRAYYSGARQILNMLSLPQGGVTMRGGLAHVAEIPQATRGAKLAPFAFSTEQDYLIVFTHNRLHIFRDGIRQTTKITPWTADHLPHIDWTQSLDTMIVVHPDVQPHRVMRQGRHDRWAVSPLPLQQIPKYDFDGDGKDEAENTWSSSRGWPRSVFLREGRLYFGGSRSRPQTIWGSESNGFFSFRTTDDGFDDEAVEASLDGDRVSAVEQLYALDDFFAFTSGGLFVHNQSPTTPKNFYFSRQSELPAANIRPVELDGSVVFIRRGKDGHHQSLHELVYDDSRRIYATQDLGLLAATLLRSPVSMAVRLGNESDSANHLFVINGDGTIAVLNSRKSQQITGWTLLQTQGHVLDCAVVGNTAYFLVKRRLNDRDQYYIEKLDPTYHFDASIKQSVSTPQSHWWGLMHLNGHNLALNGDGVYLGTQKVHNGRIITPYPVKTLEAGLPFDWAVETMPVEAQLADGTLIGNRHRIVKATIRVQNTHAMAVNGHRMAFSDFGDKKMGAASTPFTGLKTMRFLGWSGGRKETGATIRMTGQSSGPATILSVTAEIAS